MCVVEIPYSDVNEHGKLFMLFTNDIENHTNELKP